MKTDTSFQCLKSAVEERGLQHRKGLETICICKTDHWSVTHRKGCNEIGDTLLVL